MSEQTTDREFERLWGILRSLLLLGHEKKILDGSTAVDGVLKNKIGLTAVEFMFYRALRDAFSQLADYVGADRAQGLLEEYARVITYADLYRNEFTEIARRETQQLYDERVDGPTTEQYLFPPALEVIVLRTQHAVGHGGFHVGEIVVRKAPDQFRRFNEDDVRADAISAFTYVYDCGSDRADLVRSALSTVTAAAIDMLFVSHLHSDHINGIADLLKNREVHTVILPYLEVEDLAAIALRCAHERNLTNSMVEYISDPIRWWTDRGVRRVVMIEPGEGLPDEPGAGGAGPEPRLGPLPPGDPEIGPAARATLAPRFIPARMKPETASSDLAEVLLVGGGSAFKLEWQASPGTTLHSGDWMLLPYVPPVDAAVRANFRQELLDELGLAPEANGNEIRDRLINRLKWRGLRGRRGSLIAIYNRHFGNGHNRVSLHLFSGPIAPLLPHVRIKARDENWQTSVASQSFEYPLAAGWLKTGDAPLKNEAIRTSWQNFSGVIGITWGY